MISTEETLAAMRREMRPLSETAMEGVLTRVRGVLEKVEQQRAEGLAEVAEERAKGLAKVDARWEELAREVATMQKHKEAQEGHIELNIGGYHFQTSVQTLRRVPYTFFDAYFSGRYAQDVCDDGSIFVDQDGEHFGHILDYMRDGVVSVAEPGARSSVSLLRALKREFGFYCIELCVEQVVEEPEVAYAIGGFSADGILSSMERYDASSEQWRAMAAMGTARARFGTCVVAGELYVTGGFDSGTNRLSSVEKYTPSSDTWSTVVPLPTARFSHAAVAVGSDMYVLGGSVDGARGLVSVLKFDSTQGMWRQMAPMPEPRTALSACAVGNDIFAFGGADPVNGTQSSVFKFDTEANAWSTLAPMPHACDCHSVSVLDGLVYIVGVGTDGCQVLRFDLASGAYSTLAPTSSNRKAAAPFMLGGCLYVAGEVGGLASRVERYDVASNTWAAVADMVGKRMGFGTTTIRSDGPAKEQDLFDSLIAKVSSRFRADQ